MSKSTGLPKQLREQLELWVREGRSDLILATQAGRLEGQHDVLLAELSKVLGWPDSLTRVERLVAEARAQRDVESKEFESFVAAALATSAVSQ